MVCGLRIRAYENEKFVFLQYDMYAIWKVNKENLEWEEISEDELNRTEKKETDFILEDRWLIYPRTDLCVFNISNIHLVVKYSGSEAMAHLYFVTRNKEEALKFAEKKADDLEPVFF